GIGRGVRGTGVRGAGVRGRVQARRLRWRRPSRQKRRGDAAAIRTAGRNGEKQNGDRAKAHALHRWLSSLAGVSWSRQKRSAALWKPRNGRWAARTRRPRRP